MTATSDARPLRVLCVTPAGPDGMGGIDRLFAYMREAGTAPDIDIRYFAARGHREGWRSFLTFPFRLLAFIFVLLRSRVELVHLNHSTHGSAVRKWALALVARAMGRRVTTHFHGMVTDQDYTAKPLWLSAFRQLCGMSERIVVLGEVFVPWFEKRLGGERARLVVIPNGIPDFASALPVPKPNGAPALILFAGEVGYRKGAGLLLEALAILRVRRNGWRCVMAGNGDIAEYRTMVRMLGLADHVTFTGWIDAPDLHALMLEADLVVLPSRVEALPLSLIEGACAGAALVASAAGASAEVARDGRNGTIIPLDCEPIADAIEQLLADPVRLSRMKSASRALFVERFRIEIFAGALFHMFREVVQRPAASGALVRAS